MSQEVQKEIKFWNSCWTLVYKFAIMSSILGLRKKGGTNTEAWVVNWKSKEERIRWSLSLWIRSISNHLWWCAKTCGGNKELFKEKWISIVYHTAHIHPWDSADLYEECARQPIPSAIARTRRWLRPSSSAHNALKEVVLDKNLLKNIQQLTLCCHTGNL